MMERSPGVGRVEAGSNGGDIIERNKSGEGSYNIIMLYYSGLRQIVQKYLPTFAHVSGKVLYLWVNFKTHSDMKKLDRNAPDWAETLYQITVELHDVEKGNEKSLHPLRMAGGDNALMQFAIDLTDDFERVNKDREWDGEWREVVFSFVGMRVKPAALKNYIETNY